MYIMADGEREPSGGFPAPRVPHTHGFICLSVRPSARLSIHQPSPGKAM